MIGGNRERVAQLERENRVLRKRLERLEEQAARTERIQWATQEARERISRKLIALNEKYRTVVEQANDGVVIITTDAQPEILFTNPAFVLMVGADHAEDVAGLEPGSVLPEIDWRDIREGEQGSQHECRLHQYGGRQLDVLVTLSRIVYQDEPAQLALVRDISARKNAERKLARYQAHLEEEVQRRTEEMARFTEATAHHLQEPVRHVALFAQRLERSLAGEVSGNVEHDLQRVVAKSRELSALLNGLQCYLALDTLDLRPEAIAPAPLIQKAWQSLADMVAASGASLVLAPDLPTVQADPAAFYQIMQLLLANAVLYRREGVAPEVVVSAQSDGSQWRFTVTDNGCGIDPAFRERVFRMFERMPHRDEPLGAGIGLSLARRLVGAHGGRMGLVEPEEPPGTTAWFTLSTQG